MVVYLILLKKINLFSKNVKNIFLTSKNSTIDDYNNSEFEKSLELEQFQNESNDNSFDCVINYNLLMRAKPTKNLISINVHKLNTKDLTYALEKICLFLEKYNLKFKHEQAYKLVVFCNWLKYSDMVKKLNRDENLKQSKFVSYCESNCVVIFEIELCRLFLNNIYTISFKRIVGGSIYYKEITKHILNSLDFIIPNKSKE